MDCRYCGKPAGFWKREHPECADRHEAAGRRIPEIVARGACDGRTWREIEPEVKRALREGFRPTGELPEVVGAGLEAAARKVLDDDLLDEEEERRVLGFIASLAGSEVAEAPIEEVRQRLEHAGVVRLVLEGRNPWERQPGVSVHGFRFMKSESPVWAFDPVDYEIVRTRVQYTGGSRGASFRVANGLYLRTGSIRGERHTIEERQLADSGRLLITTKHVYFAGTTHRFRIRHDRVVSYEPLPAGFEVTRDRANARPERFHGMDGWFAYNLLMNAEELP